MEVLCQAQSKHTDTVSAIKSINIYIIAFCIVLSKMASVPKQRIRYRTKEVATNMTEGTLGISHCDMTSLHVHDQVKYITPVACVPMVLRMEEELNNNCVLILYACMLDGHQGLLIRGCLQI